MFNLDKFIGDSVTFRAESMFKADKWQTQIH